MRNALIAAGLMFCFGFLFVLWARQRTVTTRTPVGVFCWMVLGGVGFAVACFAITLALTLFFHVNGTWRW